jgi:hypothetical protein
VNSALNKIFGRDFVIGFFLPGLLFVVGTFILARILWPQAGWLQVNWSSPLEGTSAFVLVALVFAVFLQSINREIFRTVEGYGWGIVGSPFRWFHRWRFRRLEARKEALFQKPEDLTDKEQTQLNSFSSDLAQNYPSKETLILPTSFGNAVRAYEDYSRVVYGFESIHGWTRLQGFMSKEFRETLGGDRARVDLWLNLFVLLLVYAIEVGGVARFKAECPIWLVPLFLVAAWLAYLRARSSAQQFGEQVKAAFDIYLPALATSLGYALSPNAARNREFWKAFNEVMVYRDAQQLRRMSETGLQIAPSSSRDPAPAPAVEPPDDDEDDA